ncbi:inositol-3-phosphate synthase [Compostimonas suwonensis]|uniref:Myo-inositol-1-phosphate synthase n=1 Tax=Compostimonas suwonensis TaxID=1048394 RepID=A0A2M9BU03_9MICO|nr:inositol-3-phosphate synthase [Compostimonas suwonensis]PJJ61423.1 myo-inositol-1-phosphate synthase [Compostimonas suwonensis]
MADSERTGIWFIGARGSVATTATIGLYAIRRGVAASTGLVTAGADFVGVDLPSLDSLVVGGHDVSGLPLQARAQVIVDGGMVSAAIVAQVADELALTEQDLRPGYSVTSDETQQDAAERLRGDIVDFRERHGLARVVVVDVASTEPLVDDVPEFHDAELLGTALADPTRRVLPPSSLAAYAAILAGSPYVGFTPSSGMSLPVLVELATRAGLPIAGQDGKTGETLLRTALAPMFRARGMRVLSWAGANLLGGGDGATLADPEAVRSKLASKNRGLHELLGDDVVTPLHIDNVPDLGDVKTAWDNVHVEGFLGSRLTLQTTWTAYDSSLAAPLVLDLVRLLSLAHIAGTGGPVAAMGFFFKDPWGSDVHDFGEQTRALVDWAHTTSDAVAAAAPVGDAPAEAAPTEAAPTEYAASRV